MAECSLSLSERLSHSVLNPKWEKVKSVTLYNGHKMVKAIQAATATPSYCKHTKPSDQSLAQDLITLTTFGSRGNTRIHTLT